MNTALLVLLMLGGGFGPGAPSSSGGGYATIQEDGTPLTQRTTVNFTGAGATCSDSGGITVCNIPGGSGNTLETTVALSGGSGFFRTVVTGQTWVTSSSKIVCSVFATTSDSLTVEAITVAGLTLTISDRVVGTGFNVNVFSPFGLDGTVRVHCFGA